MEIKGVTIKYGTEEKNKGFNFLNIDEIENKEFFIDVYVKREQTLLKEEEDIVVNSNLGIREYRSYGGTDVFSFLEELEDFCKKILFFDVKSSNRKNMPSHYGDIDTLKDKTRDRTLIFSTIKIRVTESAEELLKEEGIENFKEEIKKMLDLQQKTTKSKQKLIERFIYLKEKELTLKNFLGKNNVVERYSYNKKPKESSRILITKEEYNQKLKNIEIEMKAIAKELSFEIRELNYLVDEEDPYTYTDEEYY